MGIFAAFKEGFQDGMNKAVSVPECIAMVERFLKECGVNLSNAKLEDSLTWVISKGSASIFISISKNEFLEETTLEITSPILRLPSQNILPFYRRCLEINGCLVGCAICACDDRILVTSERTLRGLDYQEVEEMILAVANAADLIDDELSEEFGAKLFNADD